MSFSCFCKKIRLISISGIDPDILVRAKRPYPLQKMEDSRLIIRIHRLASEHRDAFHILRTERLYYLILDLIGKRLSIIKIPCLRLETSPAVVTAAGYEKRSSYARAVSYITVFDIAVIHR